MAKKTRKPRGVSDKVREALKDRRESLQKIAWGSGVTEIWLRKILKGANASKEAEKRILDYMGNCPTCGRPWPHGKDGAK